MSNLDQTEQADIRGTVSYAEEQIYISGHQSKHSLTDKELIIMFLKKVKMCEEKITSQKNVKVKDIKENKSKNINKHSTSKKQFFFKQLADIVESVTGAATVACGLNLTQSYLK